jgi:hypothetical protein
MRRYFTLIAVLLFSLPVGLSITGCVTNETAYCNNSGFGQKTSTIANVSLTGGTTGISLAYGQIGQAGAVTATNCHGSTLSTGSPTYGSSNLNLADISPTGSICAGTWNRQSPGGVPDFTICTPPAQSGVAQITGSVGGVSSNPVAVYVHPAISSITIPPPQTCVSQNSTAPPPVTQAYDSSGAPIDASFLGPVSYAAVTPSIVSINNTNVQGFNASEPNGEETAGLPGATVITATISKVTSSAGYFYTCPPASIGLTLNGATNAVVAAGSPQNLVATIPDTNGHYITGLTFDYDSTQPREITVSSAGLVSSAFPGASAITAICQPGSAAAASTTSSAATTTSTSACNPAPINVIGTFGTGLPIVSNRIGVTSPGTNSTLLWAASPNSQFFSSFDLSLGTSGSPQHLPYIPNSMVLDQPGTSLYFGSYRELMIYSATTNSLSKEDTSVPGVVLAVSPSGATVVINDQIRQVIYLYTPSTGANISIGGLATRAVYSPDGKNLYLVGPNAFYVYNSSTGWSTYPITTEPAEACTLNNASLNPYCSPDVALSVPSVAPFLSGTQTSAHSFCPNDTLSPSLPPYYPLAATINVQTDHLATTDDGAHVIGATTSNIVDIQHSPSTDSNLDLVPSGSCPFNSTIGGDPLATTPVTLATTYQQLPLSGITPTQINQVLASANSTQIFFTYDANNATGIVPMYTPSPTAGAIGSLTNIQLNTGAQDPIAGIISPDTTNFFVSTTGDNLIHQVSTSTLKDLQTLNPQLNDPNNQPVPAQFLVAKPRPTT